MNRKLSVIVEIIGISLSATMVACGAGGSAKSTTLPAAVSVSISPATATVAAGAHQQFLNTTNATVTWFVDSVAGGNSTVGTITEAGLYTAPSTTSSHAITAVNPADTTKSATATVMVNASSGGGSTPTSPTTPTSPAPPVTPPTTPTPPAPAPPVTPPTTPTPAPPVTPPTTPSPTPPTGDSPTAPSGATVYSNIDQMGGWSSCGSCAGLGGNGPNVPYSLTLNVSSPSMDGQAAHFWIGGKTRFADALWWKELGANDKASHFIQDLYFYYTNAGASQALEFDGNQAVGGKKYIFGHQCNIAAGQWDVWNTAGTAWVHTGIACSAPPTNTWNHLVLEYERTNGQTHFVSITLNGKKSYVNRYYNARSSGGSELNVAFQMDETASATNYDAWLDKVTLSAW